MATATLNANPTLIGTWLTPFVSALNSYGINGEAFLAENHIDYQDMANAQRRIPIAQMSILWEHAVNLTGDELFGIRVGRYATPTTFSSLGVAILSSCSTKDLLRCYARYSHVFSTAADIRLEETDEHFIVHAEVFQRDEDIAESKDKPSHYAIDAVLSSLHTLINIHPQRVDFLERVELTRSQPKGDVDYSQMFNCEVSFNNPSIKMICNKAAVEKSLPDCNQQLAHATEKICASELATLHQNDTLAQIRHTLFKGFAQGDASLETIAAELYMSPRTLHRKLEEKDTSFRREMESVRHELAVKYLKQNNLSLGEISYKLGYSSSSNFSRAFKRWTGKTPQAFRRNHGLSRQLQEAS